jgi:hypothetical protein
LERTITQKTQVRVGIGVVLAGCMAAVTYGFTILDDVRKAQQDTAKVLAVNGQQFATIGERLDEIAATLKDHGVNGSRLLERIATLEGRVAALERK